RKNGPLAPRPPRSCRRRIESQIGHSAHCRARTSAGSFREMWEDDGVDRSWFGEVVDATRLYDDAPIWTLLSDFRKDEPLYWYGRPWGPRDEPGVYIIQTPHEHRRVRGRSDIYYIGMSSTLRTRLRNHEVFYSRVGLEVTFKHCWEVSEARALEALLLE